MSLLPAGALVILFSKWIREGDEALDAIGTAYYQKRHTNQAERAKTQEETGWKPGDKEDSGNDSANYASCSKVISDKDKEDYQSEARSDEWEWIVGTAGGYPLVVDSKSDCAPENQS